MNRFQLAGCVGALVSLPAACAPASETYASREEAAAASSPFEEPPPVPGTTRSGIAHPEGPIAQGEADVAGLTSEQIDVMFAAAFEQAEPFPEHEAVCLAMATDSAGLRRDPPEIAIRSFRQLTTLPVLPASRCAFDIRPVVIENQDPAMLYTIVIEPRQPGEPMTFWARATYGNLGANGAKFYLRRGLRGWYADFANVRSIS